MRSILCQFSEPDVADFGNAVVSLGQGCFRSVEVCRLNVASESGFVLASQRSARRVGCSWRCAGSDPMDQMHPRGQGVGSLDRSPRANRSEPQRPQRPQRPWCPTPNRRQGDRPTGAAAVTGGASCHAPTLRCAELHLAVAAPVAAHIHVPVHAHAHAHVIALAASRIRQVSLAWFSHGDRLVMPP